VARSAAAVNPEFLVKTGKNSVKMRLLIDLPKWEILLIDESDRQEQPEEVLGATGLR
jgi:hypothetical protein